VDRRPSRLLMRRRGRPRRPSATSGSTNAAGSV